MRTIVRVVAMAAVGLLAVGAAAASAAASAWSVRSLAMPAGAQSATLEGVSCTATSACMAVGWYSVMPFGYVGMAERWDGSRWSIVEPAQPQGLRFFAVSCTSRVACTAVASTVGSTTIIERWNGRLWTVQKRLPNWDLYGVSCWSRSGCVAVGDKVHASGGVFYVVTSAMNWDGSRWVSHRVPDPAAGADNGDGLNGVSCSSATMCVAVGELGPDCSDCGAVTGDIWNGDAWRLSAVQPANRFVGVYLSAISCPSPTDCTAVGKTNSRRYLLIERWTHHRWKLEHAPRPLGRFSSTSLNGVSCPRASTCTAVGGLNFQTSNPPKTPKMLAVRGNGTTWSTQPIDVAPGTTGWLNGVSCPKPTACIAAGSITTAGVQSAAVARWHG